MSSTNQPFKYKHTWEAAAVGDLEELKKMHSAGFPLEGII